MCNLTVVEECRNPVAKKKLRSNELGELRNNLKRKKKFKTFFFPGCMSIYLLFIYLPI